CETAARERASASRRAAPIASRTASARANPARLVVRPAHRLRTSRTPATSPSRLLSRSDPDHISLARLLSKGKSPPARRTGLVTLTNGALGDAGRRFGQFFLKVSLGIALRRVGGARFGRPARSLP